MVAGSPLGRSASRRNCQDRAEHSGVGRLDVVEAQVLVGLAADHAAVDHAGLAQDLEVVAGRRLADAVVELRAGRRPAAGVARALDTGARDL